MGPRSFSTSETRSRCMVLDSETSTSRPAPTITLEVTATVSPRPNALADMETLRLGARQRPRCSTRVAMHNEDGWFQCPCSTLLDSGVMTLVYYFALPNDTRALYLSPDSKYVSSRCLLPNRDTLHWHHRVPFELLRHEYNQQKRTRHPANRFSIKRLGRSAGTVVFEIQYYTEGIWLTTRWLTKTAAVVS